MTDAPRLAGTIVDALRWRRDHEPDAVALVSPDGAETTCRQWYDRALVAAYGLVARGVRPGDPVLLVADDRHWSDFAVSYVGVLLAGGVAVPVPVALYPAIAATPQPLLGAVTVRHGELQVPDGPWPVVADLDLAGHPEAPSPLPELHGSDPAEISFTAGTEGPPKAVLSSHDTLTVRYTAEESPSQPGDGSGYLLVLPFGNTFAHTVFIDAMQTPGARLYVAGGFRPEDFVDRLCRAPIEVTFLVPAMVEALLRTPDLPWDKAGPVEVVCVSGAPVRAEALAYLGQVLPHATVVNSYCSTEAWPAGTDWAYTPDEAVNAGRPWECREVRVIAGDGTIAAPGDTGRVQLRTRGVRARRTVALSGRLPALGPDAVAAWVGTDDLGFLDDHGRLHLIGRRGDVFTVGGLQIAPAQLEAVLLRHPAVRDAVVLPSPHPSLGAIPVALVVPSGEVTRRELLRVVIDEVGADRAPRAVYFVPAVPRSAAGKVVRADAAELLARVRRVEAALRDEATVVSYLAGVVAELVNGVEAPDGWTNFFEHGGDSLAALRLCRRIKSDYGVAVQAREVAENPALRDLAEVVTEQLRRAEDR
ncbi:AMP-binding protein [Micromonospora sp. LOL_024]|uniref:AMP-binding protein n=1 Tax=Micromonospora sp. LOL_024 TaxID=3345412 RepID=UPI003A847940